MRSLRSWSFETFNNNVPFLTVPSGTLGFGSSAVVAAPVVAPIIAPAAPVDSVAQGDAQVVVAAMDVFGANAEGGFTRRPRAVSSIY